MSPPSAPRKLLVLETHPIQYRAPIFQAYERMFPGEIEVVFASDFSVRGYADKDFGTRFAWDVPLMSGYTHRVLDNLVDSSLEGPRSLSARGVFRLVGETRPDALLMHTLAYHYNWAAYAAALWYRIPVWLRVETQEEAVERTPLKSALRSVVYRLAYAGLAGAFYIGELNRRHLRKHGVPEDHLVPARYCTADPIGALPPDEKQRERDAARRELGLPDDAIVVGFFGKLIGKKDPALALKALLDAPGPLPRLCPLFVGSGELEPELRSMADALKAKHGIETVFAGFVNQSKLWRLYLASDVVVLPSRRMGETWGLVVNEALQAGCGVVVSEAVGSSRDFGHWARVRVIPQGDAPAMLAALRELAALPRDFAWASAAMKDYSVEASARAFRRALDGSSMPVAAAEAAP